MNGIDTIHFFSSLLGEEKKIHILVVISEYIYKLI